MPKPPSKQEKAEKDLDVAVSALHAIANTEQGAHEHQVITSVGKAAKVAQHALDEIGEED